MKHLVTAVLALTFVGCASISDPAIVKTFNKVAVVSVVSNDALYYVGESDSNNGILSTTISASDAGILVGSTKEILAKAEEDLIIGLKGALGVALADKATILSSAAYAGTEEAGLLGLAMFKANGYKFLNANDPKLVTALKEQTGTDAALNVSFTFQKNLKVGMFGTGSMGARTTISVQIYNTLGNLVFTKSYFGDSKDAITVVANVYNPSEFLPLAIEATQTAITSLSSDLAR